MRDFLKSSGRRLSTGWFWPLVLLALPNCVLPSYESGNPDAFDPGPEPRSSAIMCDIAKVMPEGSDPCATDADIEAGMPMAQAAVALATGQWKTIALDYSLDATTECGGKPKKVIFEGPFPDGYRVCLNCQTQIPAVYVDANAACVAVCKDLINNSEGPTPAEGVDLFCNKNARVSTNFDKTICYDGACTDGGSPLANFIDPRRNQELVKWVDFIGTVPQGNSLVRTAATTGNQDVDFNAGAASAQVIMRGDAWVEFQANDTGVSHVLGVSTSCSEPTNCPDADPSLADIGFAISLNYDNQVYVLENGATEVFGPFGEYTTEDRFRLNIVDNNDGTANISYTRVIPPCDPGTACGETPLYQHAGKVSYPFRIDATLRDQNAQLTNVTIVRIQ